MTGAPRNQIKLVYAASPYSDESADVRLFRYRFMRAFCAQRISWNIPIVSPIVYGHSMAVTYKLPGDADYWETFNYNLIQCCTHLWVVQLPGWEKSKGIEKELRWAKALNLPVTMINPEGAGIDANYKFS